MSTVTIHMEANRRVLVPPHMPVLIVDGVPVSGVPELEVTQDTIEKPFSVYDLLLDAREYVAVLTSYTVLLDGVPVMRTTEMPERVSDASGYIEYVWHNAAVTLP